MKKLTLLIAILMVALTMTTFAGISVKGIDITLKNTKTKQTLKTKTDKNGKYSFKKLNKGSYILTVSVKGKSMSVGNKRGEMLIILESMDASRGTVTGKRQHKPVRITKEIDKSSPMLSVAIKDWVKASYDGGNKRSSSKDDHNASRSNTTSRSSKPSSSQSDHNTTRSNRATSNNTSERSNHNSTRSNRAISNNNDDIIKEIDKSSPKLTIIVKKKIIHGHVTVLK